MPGPKVSNKRFSIPFVCGTPGPGLGLGVNAGHGLNYLNMSRFRSVTEIDEVSIGHAVIARAVFVGIDRAVKEMLALVA